MAKYKLQHTHLLFIDRQIREKRFPNCQPLPKAGRSASAPSKAFSTTCATNGMRPWPGSARQRDHDYIKEQYQLPAITIRESDLFAICLADKLLGQYKGLPIYDSLRFVFRNIEDSLPDKVVTPGIS